MDTTSHRQWLAGWYRHITPEHTTFASKHTPASDWQPAAAWLRDQLYQGHTEWGDHPVNTWHVVHGHGIEYGPFQNTRYFIDWALHHRQNQSIWGRDQERCYYLIPEGDPIDPAPAMPPADITPPLTIR